MGKKDTPDIVASETAAEETAQPRLIITVTAPAGPRRRAGLAFSPHPVHLGEDVLDEATMTALTADPLLVIRPYEARAEAVE